MAKIPKIIKIEEFQIAVSIEQDNIEDNEKLPELVEGERSAEDIANEKLVKDALREAEKKNNSKNELWNSDNLFNWVFKMSI